MRPVDITAAPTPAPASCPPLEAAVTAVVEAAVAVGAAAAAPPPAPRPRYASVDSAAFAAGPGATPLTVCSSTVLPSPTSSDADWMWPLDCSEDEQGGVFSGPADAAAGASPGANDKKRRASGAPPAVATDASRSPLSWGASAAPALGITKRRRH